MTACAAIIIARLALILAQEAYESCYHRRVRQTLAQCTQIELVGDRVRAHFDSDLIPAPGQFLLARLIPAFDPYLRRPLFPTQIADSGFAVVFSPTDPALNTLAPGAKIDLIGPVGAATPDFPFRTRVLLVADPDPSALLPFAARVVAQGGTATLLLSTHYPLDALDPEIELRIGDLPTLAAEFAPSADLVFICAGRALHRPIHRRLTEARSFVSREYARALVTCPMPCGTGACGACAVKTIHGWKMACVDGPFFSLTELDT